MTSTALDINHHGATATALAIQPGQISWDPTQLAALGQLGLADASDGDRSVFLHVSQRTGLDPFARQIYMIPRREKVPGTQNWRTKWTIQTGIEGWRVIRDRAERRYGVRGTLSRATWYDGDGNEHKVWVRPDPPAACELTYTVKDSEGTETPYTSVLQFREYAQTGSDGGLIAQWAAKKSHMLEKCTEADVYRKAFPQDFSGIYLDDTMPAQQEDAPLVPPRGRVTAGEIISRGPAAEDDTQAGPGRALAGDGGRPDRTQSDPRAAGAASPRGAQPPPPQPDDEPRPPPRATSGQLSMLGQRLGKLGVGDENRLGTLEKLSGRDLGEPGHLTQDEAARIRGLLDRCTDGKGAPDRGALVELLATGQLPEAEKAAGGDE
jgi:phage recombination protein Bet